MQTNWASCSSVECKFQILQKRWNTWSVLAITVSLATGMTCVNGTATQPVSAW